MEKANHYLDNSATTAPSRAAREAAIGALDVYGNPSSTHSLGVEARALLEESRRKVLLSLGIRRLAGGALVFTSSGTESDSLALLGYHFAKNRKKGGAYPTVIIGEGEHPAVERSASRLGEFGYNIVKVPTKCGELDLEFLRENVRSAPGGVALASFMLVNNETGALYDVRRAADIVHTANPASVVHCDAVQGFMKTDVSPLRLGVDLLTVSAHKIHAPRGAAALYVAPRLVKGRDIAAVTPGGGQESAYRSGTENLCCIAAFAAACEEGAAHFEKNRERVAGLRSYFNTAASSLMESGLSVKCPVRAVPDIISLTLPRIKSETMLNFLSGKGIYVSAGSACSSHAGKLSEALAAFGCTKDEADSTLRVSLSHTNTEENIDALVAALSEGMATLARF